MNSETSNDGNEATTPPRDETPSPEGSGLFEICVTLTKEDKPVIVPKSGAIPSSPASACLSSTVGPVESESPYNEDSFYELLALFRKEFEMNRNYILGSEVATRGGNPPLGKKAPLYVGDKMIDPGD